MELTREPESIDNQRRALVGRTVQVLLDVAADLREHKHSCQLGCDLFLLGTIDRTLHHWKLAWPFPGVSFVNLSRAIRKMQTQTWYVGPRPVVSISAEGGETKAEDGPAAEVLFPDHHCSTRGLINPQLYHLEVALDGLKL
jgi:hypothetical protein